MLIFAVLLTGNMKGSIVYGSIGIHDKYEIMVEDMPDHLNFSTYFGGSNEEYRKNSEDLGISGVAVDSNDNIIVVGRTSSTDFPTSNAYQETFGGGLFDAFIYKLSSDGQSVIFSTFFGGSGQEWATDVAVCENGDIVIIGSTASTDLPIMNAYQSSNKGGVYYSLDIFIAKFNSLGDLLFSSYFGGTGDDWGYSIDCDSSNRFVITGSTYSADLPIKDAFQSSTISGSVDCYVTMFASNGQSLIFSTFIGSTGNDGGASVKFDGNGDIVLTGLASASNFPTQNAFDSSYNGGAWDSFLSKFHPNGTLVFSTFYGGTEADRGYDIAFDSSNNIILVGSTTSYTLSSSENAIQESFGGIQDGYIIKLSEDGQIMLYKSFFGGSGKDEAFSVVTDSEDNIIVGGFTESNDIATKNAFQSSTNGGANEAFIFKLNATYELLYATFLGGSGSDLGSAVAITSEGNIILTGSTTSENFPVLNSYQSTKDIGYDSFVIKFNTVLVLPTNEGNVQFVYFFIAIAFLSAVKLVLRRKN